MRKKELEKELETLRENAVLVKNKRAIIAIFVALIIMIISIICGPSFYFVAGLLAVSSIIGAFVWPNPNEKEFYKVYREKVTYATLSSIIDECIYNYDKGIPKDVIDSTEMMDVGDVFSSNDYISGKYKGVKFDMSDVKVEEERKDRRGNTHYLTIFYGQWYIIDFNKKFKANFQIVEKNFRNAKIKKGIFVKKEERKRKVEVEDIEFNKIFDIYALNDLDVFYVLTPKIIEKIKEVNIKVHGSLLFCFVDNKLHIGLNNDNDLFEVNINKKINIEKAKEKIKNEISIITDFIDILNLDNDLFNKEKEV